MTFTEIPGGVDEFEELPSYPTAFGITFTPLVSGVILGIIGIIASGYMTSNYVMPAWQKYNQLKQEKAQKLEEISEERVLELDQQIAKVRRDLKVAETIKPQLMSFFASEKTLDTLLLDINSFVKRSKAKLISFRPVGEKAEVVKDDSFGPLVKGKIKRKSFNVEIEGSFVQIQSLIRRIERLQPLLLLKEFRSEVKERPKLVYSGGNLVSRGETIVRISFRLDALLPLTEKELAELAPPPKGK